MIKQIGFTLVELMVVTALIGVLSAIAIPAFDSYTTRVKRNEDCKTPLLEIAVEMETYHSVNQTYPAAGALSATSIPYNGSKGNYTYRITASTPTTYTLQCTIALIEDPDCGSLTYDNFGRKGKDPGGTSAVDACWR